MAIETNGEARASTRWIMLLTIASTATTFALACAAPYTALAALAATRMRARDGALVMAAAWVASQSVELCVHRYPLTPDTFGWAAALLVAALAAVAAARGAMARGSLGGGARVVVAYLAAMAGFKAVILIGALFLGGGAMAFAPAVLAREAVRNGAILAGLLLLYRGLVALGVPAAGPERRWAA